MISMHSRKNSTTKLFGDKKKELDFQNEEMKRILLNRRSCSAINPGNIKKGNEENTPPRGNGFFDFNSQFKPLQKMNHECNAKTHNVFDIDTSTYKEQAIDTLSIPEQNNVFHCNSNIIMEEEREKVCLSEQLDMKEIMKNIVVYVEVRTGEDNRSTGIKKVISLLGAKVNDRFLRDTTHVVFKDGLQSTYNKAKKWNIPIVSILWIESCKKHARIIDSSLFPISNKDRYENPELYNRIKRVKSRQPDAEENIKRIKIADNKYQSPSEMKKNLIRIPKTPKDNLEDIFSQFQEKLLATPNEEDILPFQSKLLDRIKNSPSTPKPNSSRKTLSSLKKLAILQGASGTDLNSLKTPKSSETKCNSVTSESSSKERAVKIVSNPIKSVRNRMTTYCIENLSVSQNKTVTPAIQYKRRKTMYTPETMNLTNLDNQTTEPEVTIPNDITIPQTPICPLVFNSAGKPNRRKTIFDISMDIIDARLMHINRLSKINNVATNDKVSPAKEVLKDTPLQKDVSQGDAPVKRKLFVPDQMLLTPPNRKLEDELSNSNNSSSKRIKNDDTGRIAMEKKRKTLNPNLLKKPNSKDNFEDKSELEKVFQKTITGPVVVSKEIVYTNMHKEQIEFIKMVVAKLGKFKLAKNVNDSTTHLITLEPRRTFNLLKGIIRGLWILNYEWILESYKKHKWQEEDQYELDNFNRSVKICRAERQAFGRNYKMNIFLDLSPIFVSKNCKISNENIIELITLCSGHIVNTPKSAKYVIGEKFRDKICLEPQWILDSISANQIKNYHKYIMP